MKMLSIDASGKTAAVAVTDGDTLLAQSFSDSAANHSCTLLPMIDSTLSLAGVSMPQIEGFALTCGPGSFTGLRIGASLIMGLAGSRPCYPVPTLLALAMNMRAQKAVIIPVMDARRNQVYTAAFESDGTSLCRLCGDEAMPLQDVACRIEKYAQDKKVIVLGDGAYLFESSVCGIPNVVIPTSKELFTQGVSVAAAAKGVSGVKPGEIKLNYLRMSQAERELKEKQK